MKKGFLYLMSALYMLAGLNHFWHPAMYLSIMPHWLPAHELLVNLSGLAELVLGSLLLLPPTRRMAAMGIITLLVVIFPANIQMVINYYDAHDPHLWIAIVRLPVQIMLIWWAWTYAAHEL